MEDRDYVESLPPLRPLPQSSVEASTAGRVRGWLEADCERLSAVIRQPLHEKTDEEAKVLRNLAGDSRVDPVLLLNRYGQVRWAKDSACIGGAFESVEKADARTGELLLSVCQSKTPTARIASDNRNFEVGLPLMVQDHLVGVLLVKVPDAT